jgi:23S rRNA (pseudouridine1915-N3)-methyltransferase
MVNCKIVAVGKIKEKFTKDEIAEYIKRLSKYCKISIVEVDEEKAFDNSSADIERILKKEGENLLKQIKSNDYVILLDLHGQEIDSLKFASLLNEMQTNGTSSFAFVIGGSNGLSDEVRKRSNFKLKLSPLTFTHQMTRVIILEQIYRAFKINNNEIYHK